MPAKWKARWIWTAEPAGAPNTYALFRKTFRVPAAKGPALLYATAGHFYRVYLNGKRIGRGPDRCYFREKYYHTYDVSRLVKPGENVLAIHVHYLGERQENLMERIAEGPAGCLAQLEIAGRPVAWTDATWKTIQDPAYSPHTGMPSMHREWREEFFADKAVRGWEKAGFDDREWKSAEVIAPAEGGPWCKLVAKTTPELTAAPLAPKNMYIINRGGDRCSDYDRFSFYSVLDPKAARVPGDFRIWNDRQPRQELLFDMGRVVVGYPRIEIASSCGGTIEIDYGDSLSMTHWDTIHLGGGALTWEPFTTRGGRYMRLVITGAHNPIAIRSVRWVRTNYPVKYRGAFTCSDSRLDAVWRTCRLTAETCGMEHFVDCVGREQALWMMDFRFQALQHYAHFGDAALARKCFRQFAALQFPNGHLLAYGPSCRPMEQLFEKDARWPPWDWFGFNFYLLLAAWEHFQFTQDRSFVKEMYPALRKCMDYYARSEHEGFAQVGEVTGSAHVDWGYDGYCQDRKAIYSFMQALYYGALLAQSRLAGVLGRTAEAESVARKAATLERRFYKAFTSPRTGAVADYVLKGKRVFKGTIQPSGGVLNFFDRIPDKVRANCLDVLLNRRGRMPRCGIGMASVVSALFREREDKAAIKLLGDYWGGIVDAHLPQVPEFFDMDDPGVEPKWSPDWSRCHSFASLGGYLLQRHVLGVEVEGHRVRLDPQFGTLDHAEGVMPTLAGDVHISWHRTAKGILLRARAPKTVEVALAPSTRKKTVAFRRTTA
jgi:hypothetical protein